MTEEKEKAKEMYYQFEELLQGHTEEKIKEVVAANISNLQSEGMSYAKFTSFNMQRYAFWQKVKTELINLEL